MSWPQVENKNRKKAEEGKSVNSRRGRCALGFSRLKATPTQTGRMLQGRSGF